MGGISINPRIADFKHCRIGGEEADDEVWAPGGADAEGGAAEALEGELASADEGAGITAGLGVKPPEDLDDQLARRHVLI
ncbi:F-box/LRR-repeat protein 4 [Pyrus ussuriensis x Pyrus communis]|uniref:F-box/LRR-repeat protein 4 n=1 Tax=Pyrus ussuriensis x Pyrus communis TaxID=2448454 RepID=A0A5N5HCP7_9ROSA|nr:F-box/LRR-repeat protein 4 [Pyrus ussuriensis x Pyrus communis]